MGVKFGYVLDDNVINLRIFLDWDCSKLEQCLIDNKGVFINSFGL